MTRSFAPQAARYYFAISRDMIRAVARPFSFDVTPRASLPCVGAGASSAAFPALAAKLQRQ